MSNVTFVCCFNHLYTIGIGAFENSSRNKQSEYSALERGWHIWAVFVAQLVESSLPTPDV